jgi:hypothetical protein
MTYVDNPNFDPAIHERRVALDRTYHTIMNEFRSGKYTDETLPAVLREKYKEIHKAHAIVNPPWRSARRPPSNDEDSE